MSTLNFKSLHRLCISAMAAAILSTAVTINPLASADALDFYQTMVSQYRLNQQQVDNLLLVNKHATISGHPEILQAIMLQESRAGQNTKSNGNCHGIMQIMTGTALGIVKNDDEFRQKFFGVNKPTLKTVATLLKTDVVFSIEVADRIIASSLEKTTDINRAVLAYNQGERSLQGKRNPMASSYVRDVSIKVKHTIVPMQKLALLEFTAKEEADQSI